MTLALASLPPLRDVIAKYELATNKALGQHFLLDLNLTRRIAGLAGDLDGVTVFEIGPGPGGLTRALLETKAKRVIAIEKDARCVNALSEVIEAAGGRLDVISGDALEIDLEKCASPPRAIVADLPYNVGTAMLLAWLKRADAFQSMTLMFQAEVADRLVAAPKSKEYGRLSVLTQFCCDVERVLKVPAEAFTPPPKVDSAVVRLTPRAHRPKDLSFDALAAVTSAAFGQRRKMLRSSLKSLGGEGLLLKAEIAPTRRAEDLSLAEFERLTGMFQKKGD